MPEQKIVVCPQCGKKFMLKEGFDAASFTCKACGATVWVEGKPKVEVSKSKRRAGGGTRRAGRSGAAGRRGGRRPAARGRGRRQEEDVDDEEQGGRGRYQKKSSSTNMILAIVGFVVIVIVVVVVIMSSKDKAPQPPAATGPGFENPVQPPVDPTPAVTPPPVDPTQPTDGTGQPTDITPADDTGQPGTAPIPGEGDAVREPGRRLDSGGPRRSTGLRSSKWDPSPDKPHLESTSPEMRKKIDDHVTNLMDPFAGRDSLDAKEALIAIGKPAFPRLLGAMAKIRDTISDNDSHEERVLESSLKLADEALREMDGYLNAHGKSTLRPGSEKRYIAYVIRLHNKRWEQVLKDMSKMPGPFDSAQAYGDAPEDYGGGR